MRVPVVRFVFALLAAVFAAAIVVQVFLAGIALFVHVGDWSLHRSFINYFEYVPILMFILAFPGRIRGLMRWLGLVLFLLCSLQHITVQVLADVWVLGALHPIIAMLLFMFSAYGVRQSWRWLALRQDSGTIAA